MGKIPYMQSVKKNGGGLLWTAFIVFILAMAAAGGAAVYKNWAAPKIASSTGADFLVETPQSQAEEAAIAEITEADILSCNGVQSVNVLYNDRDYFLAGTDAAGNLTIYDPIIKRVQDDATSTTAPIKTSFKALAGNNQGAHSSTYFAEEVEFDTVCSDVELPVQVRNAAAPTITWVNDDGITKNSDTNHETMAASSTYTPCVTIKAPADDCSSRHGAVMAMMYDASYINEIDSSDIDGWNGKFLEAKINGENSTSDQVAAFLYPDELCDGAKDEVCFDITTTSTNPAEGQGNVYLMWAPLNKDLDTDTLSTVITDIYDDKNTIIFIGNTTSQFHTA